MGKSLLIFLKRLLKEWLAPIYFKGIPLALRVERLHLWFDILASTGHLSGAVLEIGAMHGGTSILSKKYLNGVLSDRDYYIYDTFDGFVDEQIAHDISSGWIPINQNNFRANSEKIVKKIFHIHGVSEIQIVKGDIVCIEEFPSPISAVLLDVDLEQPTYSALTKIYPLLEDEGIIMVDDCHQMSEENYKGYRTTMAVRRFAVEQGITVFFYVGGVALLSKNASYRPQWFECQHTFVGAEQS